MTVVEFNAIHQAYRRGVDVLDGVSFRLDAGQVVGLVGKNGAGKTTLIRIAMGMIEAQRGSARLFGLDPREHAVEVKRRVGFVSEDQILPGFLRVDEVLRLHAGLFPNWDPKLAQELLERFELSPRTRIRTLSKGQARQVALLCAVAHRPELLLLDEPAGGLDPATRREFLEASIRLLNDAGTTILFSSHYMTDVERMANRVVMLHEGQVLIDRELDDLRESYSLALIPAGPGVSKPRLLELDGCLGVRERASALHAVFSADPEQVESALREQLGTTEGHCTRIGLEELFVELAGRGA